ncbi:30S ribosomal protein S4 [Candidatus Micrarchaeota archaeon]|nr:30S ribosomal protein S4 [Candidatus Micrarchaeota archaeon]
MGDPRKLKKKYKTPSHPWQKKRIEEENRLVDDYGLKNKHEVWKAKTELKKYRNIARDLIGLTAEQRKEKETALIAKLEKMGFLPKGGTIDNVLSMKVEDVLERRLQTRVWKSGLAMSSKQARQLITHGHIAIAERKATSPGMIVNIVKEKEISWYGEPVIIMKETTSVPSSAVEDIASKTTSDKAEKETAKEAIDETIEAKAAEDVKKLPKKKAKK